MRLHLIKQMILAIGSLSLLGHEYLFSTVHASTDKIPPPISYEIMTFPQGHYWETILTQIDPDLEGREAQSEHRSLLRATDLTISRLISNEGDYLQQFQKLPLGEMLERGYINQAQYDQLFAWSQLGIKPEQVTLITLFSDMPRSEAEKWIKDEDQRKLRFKMPSPRPKRVELGSSQPMNNYRPDPQEKMVRVIRGTLFAIEGYIAKDENNRLRFERRPVPWEKDSILASGLERRFNSKSGIQLIEIGRTMMFGGPLKGNLVEAVHVASAYLSNKSRALGLNPDRQLIAVHALEHRRASLFAKVFPFASILTPELQGRIEADLEDALSWAKQNSRPTSEGLNRIKNCLLVCSLSQLKQALPPERISGSYHRLRENGGRTKSYEEIIDFIWNSQIPGEKFNFEYKNPSDLEAAPIRQGSPVVVNHLVNLGWWSPTVKWLFDEGVQPSNFEQAYNQLGGKLPIDALLDLNGALPHNSMNLVLPLKTARQANGEVKILTGGASDVQTGFIIKNIDPDLLKRFRAEYLAQIIIATFKRQEGIRQQLLKAPHYELLLIAFNHARENLQLPPATSLSPDKYWETYPIFFAPESDEMRKTLLAIGGEIAPGYVARLDSPQGGPIESGELPNLELGINLKPWDLVRFSYQALARLEASKPYVQHSQMKKGIYRPLSCAALAGLL